jgi:hypothetical protein
MATTNDECRVGDDMDTLTVMNEDGEREESSSNNARYQRDVSRIPEGFPAEYGLVKAILALKIPRAENPSSLSRTIPKAHLRPAQSTTSPR